MIREGGENKPGSIGPAIPDTECRLVDPESGEDVTEVVERGELWIRGPQVMKGYLNNVAETDEHDRRGRLAATPATSPFATPTTSTRSSTGSRS